MLPPLRAGTLSLLLVALAWRSGHVLGDSAPPAPFAHPDYPLMLADDRVPEGLRRIDFEQLPRMPSEHAVISDVRDSGGTRCRTTGQ